MTARGTDATLGQRSGGQVLLAAPRGFCAGVERAIGTVERALDRYGAPVYVRHQIVHNAHVVAELEDRGAVFVDGVDQIPAGAVCVFSAHGVAPAVRAAAAARGLRTVDATCPLVAKVHAEVRRFAAAGRSVIVIGHRDHDEVVGTAGEVPARTTVVATEEELRRLDWPADRPVAVVTQTTLSPADVEPVERAIDARFDDVVRPSARDVCYAVSNRQDAVRAVAPDVDVLLVVGAHNSSNANRMVEVARRAGVPARLVPDPARCDLPTVPTVATVGVSAAASTPAHLVAHLLERLAAAGFAETVEVSVADETTDFRSVPAPGLPETGGGAGVPYRGREVPTP